MSRLLALLWGGSRVHRLEARLPHYQARTLPTLGAVSRGLRAALPFMDQRPPQFSGEPTQQLRLAVEWTVPLRTVRCAQSNSLRKVLPKTCPTWVQSLSSQNVARSDP